ncbi:MAG: hypothetical protein U0271_35015 [Polyangiaceae bacterium]
MGSPSKPRTAKKPRVDAGRAAVLSRRYRLAPAPVPITEEALRKLPAGKMLVEVAWDGHRVLVAREGESVRVLSHDYREWSDELPSIKRALLAAPLEAFVAEGWLVGFDEQGRPSFEALRRKVAAGNDAGLKLVLVDLLHAGDDSLVAQPLGARRERLAQHFGSVREPLVVSEPLAGAPATVLAMVEKLGLGGIVIRELSGPHPQPATRPAQVAGPVAGWVVEPRALSPAPHVTNASKVLYPRDGITKSEVVAYYSDIAIAMLPYLARRPVVAQRWPDGIDDFTWYQHRVPPRAPDYVKAIFIEGNRRILLESRDAVVWMANQAALTLHGFVSRVGSLENPDWLILDLDPPADTPWSDVVEVALAVRKLLELLDLESVPKTSGQKGLHVLVPLAPAAPGPLVAEAARELASLVARVLPDKVSMDQEVEARRGRIYLDATQGYVGKILALPYTLRAKDGAPCSTPIAWSELGPGLHPSQFNLRTIRARLDQKGDLAAPLTSGRGADIRSVLRKLRRG